MAPTLEELSENRRIYRVVRSYRRDEPIIPIANNDEFTGGSWFYDEGGE